MLNPKNKWPVPCACWKLDNAADFFLTNIVVRALHVHKKRAMRESWLFSFFCVIHPSFRMVFVQQYRERKAQWVYKYSRSDRRLVKARMRSRIYLQPGVCWPSPSRTPFVHVGT